MSEYSKIIYIAESPSIPDFYKIGQTHNLETRINLLSNGTPEDFFPIITFAVPEAISDSDVFRFLEVRILGCRYKNINGKKTEFFYKSKLPYNVLLHVFLEFAQKYKLKINLISDLFFDPKNNTNFNPNANRDIKEIMKKHNVTQLQIANALDICPYQFRKYLGYELLDEEKKKIIEKIFYIASKKDDSNA